MSGTFPADDGVLDVLRVRIDICKRAVGGIIGLVDERGERMVAYGHPAHDESGSIRPDAIFELGCVTKVLTALLCGDMLERGEIRLDEALAPYLPPDVPTVGRNGVAITVAHLLTHSSGLPDHPLELLAPIEQVHEFLRDYVPRHDVGAYYEYSTLGFSLLGEVLARRAGTSHADLVGARICAPLGMTDTSIHVSAASASRVVTGHDTALVPLPPTGIPPMTGGYGFRSTARDLLRLAAACTGRMPTALDPAIARTMSIRRPGRPGIERMAMGWHITALNGIELFVQDGRSTGHRAFVGFVPQERRGMIALLNGVAPGGVTDACRHFLNPAYSLLPPQSPLLRPPREAPPSTVLGAEDAAPFVGLYQLTPRFRLDVRSDADGLTISDGRETQRLRACGAREFWIPATGIRLDTLLRFDGRGDEPAKTMTVTDQGWDRKFVRVGEVDAPIWHGRRASTTPPASLNKYAGCYQFGYYVLEVRCVERTLLVQWVWAGRAPSSAEAMGTGGTARPQELAHEHDHQFIVDADDLDSALTFEPGPDEQIVAVTCRMGENHERGVRIPALAL